MPKRWSFDGMWPRKNTDVNGIIPIPNIVVAVMGMTGTGKSSFIQLLSGDKRIEIGHGQDSKTADVRMVRYHDKATGCCVTLIDTPGFDDSRAVPDAEILQRILDFLKPEQGEPRKLNGLIYMHNISSPRFTGIQHKNLRVFRSLCGDDNLKRVRIVTTNWDRVTKSEGEEREKELKAKQFKVLVDAGAGMHRHRFNDKKSAHKVMLEFPSVKPIMTQIQKELKDPNKKLEDTSAGAVLAEMVQEVRKKHEKERAELQIQLDEARAELARRDESAAEFEELQKRMKIAEEDNKKLATQLEELEKQMKIAEEDRKKLAMTLDDLRTMVKTQRIPDEQIMGS